MVCLSTVGFALAVVVVLEFYSACRAVCDAHGLRPGEYLFSELFVFACACSAHRCSFSSFSLFVCFVLVLGGGASQRQRDERLHRLTLLFLLSSLFAFLLFWVGVWCVVRAQLCEHARNTPHALVLCVCVYSMGCVLLLPQHSACSLHHTLFVVNVRHVHH